MRVGLVVDSACDLPYQYILDNDIFILPISVRIDGELFVDDHDPVRTLDFYQSGRIAKGHDAESVPYSAEQIRDLFLEQIVVNYDFAFLETITRVRSPIYQNAWEAMHAVLKQYRAHRQAAGREGAFSMRAVNSRSLFAGQGVLAAHTLRLIRSGVAKAELRSKVEALTGNLYAYVVPPDLYYIRERARKKGDSSVGFLGAMLGKALEITPIVCGHNDETFPAAKVRGFDAAVTKLFDYAIERIRAGLLSPHLCVTYAGDPAIIPELPGFERLAAAAEEAGVELLTSIMSVTGGVNVGPGTVGLALAAPRHEFK